MSVFSTGVLSEMIEMSRKGGPKKQYHRRDAEIAERKSFIPLLQECLTFPLRGNISRRPAG
jgi:hypothetical protein